MKCDNKLCVLTWATLKVSRCLLKEDFNKSQVEGTIALLVDRLGEKVVAEGVAGSGSLPLGAADDNTSESKRSMLPTYYLCYCTFVDYYNMKYFVMDAGELQLIQE